MIKKAKTLSFLVASVLFVGGCGGSGSGKVVLPVGPTSFQTGFVYVSDRIGVDIPSGRIAAFPNLSLATWKAYQPPTATAINAFGMAFDAQSRLLFTTGTNSTSKLVRMDDMDGTNRVEFGSQGTGVNQFSFPEGVALDTLGRIYVADFQNQRIVRMDDMSGTNWTTLTAAQVSGMSQPRQVVFDSLGRMYILSIGGTISRVNDMTGAGLVSFQVTVPGGNIDNPLGMAIDSQDRIYITDSSHGRIVRIDDMTGANQVNFGSFGHGLGQFANPTAIAIDSTGRILIADGDNGRIVRINDMSGTSFTTVGHLGTVDGAFTFPFALAICPF